MVADTVLESLLDGIPEGDAEQYRRMRAVQRQWGLGGCPAVVVVDMTRGFVEDQFALGSSASGLPVARSIRRLLDAVRPLPLHVVFTIPGIYETEVETGGWLRGLKMSEYTIGTATGENDLVEVLTPGPGEPVIAKPKPSAFYGTQLQSLLTYWKVDTLIVTGVGTGRCVRATVEDAFARNYRVIIPVQCVGGGTGISHRVELLDMGVHIEVVADLVTLDELIPKLKARRADR